MKGIGGNVTAIIQTSATTTTEIGEQVQAWMDAATLNGWLDLSGGDSKYTVYNAKVQESTHVFVADYQALPADITTENSRLICNGKRYDVLLIDNPMEMQNGSQLEIYLKFTGGDNDMSVRFEDYSIRVTDALDGAAERFLREAAFEVEAQTKRTTPTKKTQLKGSWASDVNTDAKVAQIGSPLEESFWNEFGTGSYAIHGDGRKGWWVYIEGQSRGAKNSKVYNSQQEAEEAAEFLRKVKGLPAVVSNGEPPQRTLENAFAAKKNAIIRMAENILKGMG